jgi:hypothetical protein
MKCPVILDQLEAGCQGRAHEVLCVDSRKSTAGRYNSTVLGA